jgi:UDP-N-acetylmuramate dehydrogenase
MNIEENIALRDFTTLKLGGPARYFTRVRTVDELREVLLWSKERNLAFFILGGGSNVLMSDKGFNGLVVKMELKGKVFEEKGDHVEVVVGAGEVWDELVEDAVVRGCYGLENLSAIPGTVGASPVQNIGAYGVEVKDSIAWVEVYDTETHTMHTLSREECKFGYRESIFKTGEGKKYIVTRVAFALRYTGSLSMSYKDIKQYFEDRGSGQPSLVDVRKAIIAIRSKKFPDLTKVGTAGSFFKNPIILRAHYDALCMQFGDIPSYPAQEGFVKVPIAWFLDRLGWKDVRRGHVGTWSAQPLVLVHYSGGNSDEFLALADEIIEGVRTRTGIILEPEVRIINKIQ